VEDYLGFLKGGCSKPPIELLKGAGVDLSTSQPIRDALTVFDQLIGELERLVKE
jgi:oligoendopeptidase F